MKAKEWKTDGQEMIPRFEPPDFGTKQILMAEACPPCQFGPANQGNSFHLCNVTKHVCTLEKEEP